MQLAGGSSVEVAPGKSSRRGAGGCTRTSKAPGSPRATPQELRARVRARGGEPGDCLKLLLEGPHFYMTAIRYEDTRYIRLALCAGTGEATSPAQPLFKGEADPMEARYPFPPCSPGRFARSCQPPPGSARSSGAHRLLPRQSPRPPPPDTDARRGVQKEECALSQEAGIERGERAEEKRKQPSARGRSRERKGGRKKKKKKKEEEKENHTRWRSKGLYANLQSPNSKSPRLGCNAEDEPM